MYDPRAVFVDGAWSEGAGVALGSRDPARDFAPVWQARGASSAQVEAAVQAGRAAQPGWAALTLDERHDALRRVAAGVEARADEIARVITAEMGKPLRESLAEVRSLPSKIEASRRAQERLPDLALPGAPGRCEWRPHGVMAVVGPFNYPLHLVHTHVAPALLAGNTAVIKSSEITPLSARLYAELLDAAGLPRGVVNLLSGGPEVGAALVAHADVDAVAFTGSWAVGRRIVEACQPTPSKLLALEMGGKNIAVVLDDADPDQALHEVVLGACLTAGQRCTATSRVLLHASLERTWLPRLLRALGRVRPGDPLDDRTQMGPLATSAARHRYLDALAEAEREGAEPLLRSEALGGGAFVTPGAHRVGPGAGDRLADTELFAPHLAIELVHSDAEALARAAQSRFGLSLSVFTASRPRFEAFARGARAGITNWNRSTNNASGLLPFGGFGVSGNQRPAGSAAALYCAAPVAVLEREPGAFDVDPRFAEALSEPSR